MPPQSGSCSATRISPEANCFVLTNASPPSLVARRAYRPSLSTQSTNLPAAGTFLYALAVLNDLGGPTLSRTDLSSQGLAGASPCIPPLRASVLENAFSKEP